MLTGDSFSSSTFVIELGKYVVEVRQVSSTGELIVRKQPGASRTGEITITRGMDKSTAFTDWIKATLVDADLDAARQNITISLKDAQKNTVRRIHLSNAWASRWEGPQLGAANSQNERHGTGDHHLRGHHRRVTTGLPRAGAATTAAGPAARWRSPRSWRTWGNMSDCGPRSSTACSTSRPLSVNPVTGRWSTAAARHRCWPQRRRRASPGRGEAPAAGISCSADVPTATALPGAAVGLRWNALIVLLPLGLLICAR